MKKHILFLFSLALLTVTNNLPAQGTAFTYQGRLNASGSPANGNYDFTFALFNNSSANPPQLGTTLTDTNVGVTNGLFTVTLDFGANFPGASRWLALAVRTNGGASFTALSPLQALTPTPYAIYTPNSGTAANVTGPIALSQLPGAVVTNGESGLNVTGTFNGNGGGLANLNLNGTQGSLRVASTPVAYSQSAAASNAVSILAGSHYAGLACGTNGLSLFDISNLFAPALVAVCNQGFTTYGFTVNQGYMYVASGAAGMRVYSVSNFASPVFVTQVADLTPYYQVVQSGGYAYVGGYSNIAIYSLSNPASPVFLGQLPKSPTIPDLQTPRGLAVAGNYLYSANAEDVSFRIYSITNPASPVLLSQTSTACVNVTISGNLAFLSAANFGFLIYDISNPSSPNLLASPPALGGGEVLSIQVSGNRCFAAEVLRGLAEYDISVTTNPVLMTVFTNTPNIEDLVLWDNFALTANFGPNALQVLAVGDTADLVAGASANAVTNNAVGVTIAGGGAQTYFFTGNPNGPAVSVGGPNQAGADFDTISGGLNNTISNGAVGALIDGGVMNVIESNALVATIGGGFSNSIGANSQSSVIGGGNGNAISSNVMAAVIAGGSQNFINTNSSGAVIGGGQNNQISSNAQNATIPGGYQNVAAGNGSFAAGQQAQAMHQGAFVWADSSGGSYSSTANNQFAVRALGGASFVTGGSGLTVDGQRLLTNMATGVSLTGTFSGNGAGLTNLAADALASTGPLVAFQTNVYSSGGTNTFTVPPFVTNMVVKLWGAGGGVAGCVNGGAGAFSQVTVNVFPGQTYTVVVGQAGSYTGTGGATGSGDAEGGNGASFGAGGGQASSLFLFNGTNYVMKAVAGGGGGAGDSNGGGGGATGTGGDPYASGATTVGEPSLSLMGGGGENASGNGAGGGGGGYGGGGAGTYPGASTGGGSYGTLIIPGNSFEPGNQSDPNYVSPNGYNAYPGLAVVIFSQQALSLPGIVQAQSFLGNGSLLTNINGANLTSLPPNAALLDASQTFTGQNSFAGIFARGGPPGAYGRNNNGYAFSGNNGDDDSGMFSLGDGQIEFYNNANEVMRIINGSVGIGTNSPSSMLEVAGTAQFDGNVGIGTSTLAATLDVAGNVHASGTFSGNGSGLTNLSATQLTSGTIPLGQLPPSLITNGAAGVNLTGTFTGNGAGVTNVALGSLSSAGDISWGNFAVSAYLGVGLQPYSVCAADVNGDGKVDLICVNYGDATLMVLTNNGSGGFVISQTIDVGDLPYSVCAADVNGDGKVDLICANYGDRDLMVLTNNGSGLFALSSTPAVGNDPISVCAADVNGDGKADLICANRQDNTLTVLTNNGSGGFVSSGTYGVGATPVSVCAADVNGDGKVDVISANEGDNTLTVLTNNGSGKFVTSGIYGVGSYPQSVCAADVNGDGKVDLICANGYDFTLTVLINNGSGGFVSNASYAVNQPISVCAADVNGDGKVDLICANEGDNTLTVLTNNGSGKFVTSGIYGVGSYPRSVCAADVNGDGKVDLICANGYDTTLTVLLNTPVYNGAFVGNGSGLTSLNAASLTGTLPVLNGASLSSLNASQLTSGTVPLAQLPSTVAFLNSNQTFTGQNSFATSSGSGPVVRVSGGQPQERIRLSGAEFYQGNSDTNGLSLVLGVNRLNNRQLWVADSGNLTPNSTNTVLRFLVGEGSYATIDATTTDGLSQKPLSLGNGANVGIGTTTPAATLDVAGNIHASGTFNGNGSGLTALNASQLTSGTIPLTQLPTTVAFLNSNQTFTGQNSFSGNVGIGTTNPIARLSVDVGNGGGLSSPAAIFAVENCGNACGQPAWTEGARLWNQNSLGRVGLSFMVGGSGALSNTPNVYVGTGDYVNSNDFRIATQTAGGLTDRLYINGTSGNVGIGVNNPTQPLQMASGAYCSAAGVWTSVSDRSVKENFTAISPREVLARVAAMPITQWKYKVEPSGTKHIGPVAQDFHAAFGLGDNDKAIGTVDESGVALAAIQGVNEKLESELKSKDAEIQDLKARLDKLEAAVKSITASQ